ncbi:MAG: hypothetical protein LBL24_05190 [Bacteroidales bacterium]|nr:hypothetical protein [Bacteroidales bacterium]
MSKPSGIFVPQSMKENAGLEFPAITVDNVVQLINDQELQKKVGLKLLATHLTLPKVDPEIISAKNFNALHKSVPSDILALTGETDSITYLNLMSQADEHPFLIKMIHHPDVPYYGSTAISSVSVDRVGISDIITMLYISDDPGIGRQTLDIILDLCKRHFEILNTDKANVIIAFCENLFQNAKDELQLSTEKLQSDIHTGIAQQREGILNRLIAEREKISVSENSIKAIEHQINMQNLAERDQNINSKLKYLNGLYHLAVNDSVSLLPQINQAHLDLKNGITAIILPLSGDRETKNKAIENYYNALITLQQSKVQAAALEDRRKALYGSAKLTPNELEEIETCDQKYLFALDELKKSKSFQQNLSAVSPIQVIEKPDYQAINRYQTLMYVLLAGMLGFIISFALMALKAVFNRKLNTPGETIRKTGLKVAGIIPNEGKIKSYGNSNHIKNILMYHMLWNFFQSDQKQRKIMVTSIYPGDGKTFVCDMLSDWLMTKGLKCKVVSPFLDNGVWRVKSYNMVGAKLDPFKAFADVDVVIMKFPPLATGDYPVEVTGHFNSTFLVCKADKGWLSSEKRILNAFMGRSKHIPQVILNNVEMDVVKSMLGKINVVKTYHAPEKRSSQRAITRKHKLVNGKEYAQQIVKSMPNLGVILDKNRQIVYANEAITSLLGLGTMDKTLGLRPGELVSCIYSDMTEGGCGTSRACRNCGAVNTIMKCIKSHNQENGECHINSLVDGQLTSFDFKISCAPLEINGDFFVVTNLADIKGSEEKRKEFLNKTVFGSGSNSDISVLGNLVEKVDESGQLDNLLDTLKQTGSSPFADEFIEHQRLVDAKNGVLKMQLTSVNAFNILDDAVRAVRTQKISQGKKIALAPPFPEITLTTDVDILAQILRSMLINAVSMVSDGDIVYAGYEGTKYALSFYVFNTGVIPEHLQNNVFQKKFTGIKLLGEQVLNGYVGYESAKESGTRFSITLPF